MPYFEFEHYQQFLFALLCAENGYLDASERFWKRD